MKSIAFLAAVAISTVAAQSAGADEGRLYYTEPVTGTVWTAGQSHSVSWNNVCNSVNTGDLNMVLYMGTGEKNGTEQVRVPNIPAIGTLNCLKSKTAKVTLPANLTSSDRYALHVDTEPLQSYSSPFSIKGVDPSPVPTTVATTPAAATSGAAATTSTATSGSVPSPSNTPNSTNAAVSRKTLGATVALLAAAVGALFV